MEEEDIVVFMAIVAANGGGGGSGCRAQVERVAAASALTSRSACAPAPARWPGFKSLSDRRAQLVGRFLVRREGGGGGRG